MANIPATVGILTFNSGQTLRRALESVKEFDDIVICDGGSADDTLSIALEYGANVISQPIEAQDASGRLIDFGKARQASLEAARYDWFLYIDADETISNDLKEDIRRISNAHLASGDPLVYKIPIGILMDGRYLKYSSTYPGYQTRFFNKKSNARFIKVVHERIAFEKNIPIGVLTHPWYIHTVRGYWDNYFIEGKRYRMLARQKHRNATWSTVLKVLYSSCRSAVGIFLRATKNYLFHGFKNAVPASGELGRICDQLASGFGVLFAKIRS